MIYKTITVKKILDSRGKATIETEINGNFASVPSGASIGSFEAKPVFADIAIKNILNIIAPELLEKPILEPKEFDKMLIKLDGTFDKSRLGANAILSLSLANTRLNAKINNLPLYKYINKIVLFETEIKPPRILANFFHGGKHSKNKDVFQEYLVIPKIKSIAKQLDIIKTIFKEINKKIDPAGDEGGFVPETNNFEEPFGILSNIVNKLGLNNKLDFGVDVALSSSSRIKVYVNTYLDLVGKYPIIYIEDPFKENDFKNFTELNLKIKSFCENTEKQKILIVGDDLTVTNKERLEKAIKEKSINSIIIKPNQIGTITETLETARVAHENNIEIIVSHRSGETVDNFISDLAYGIGAWGAKIGNLAQKERLSKYNRLVEIEKELN